MSVSIIEALQGAEMNIENAKVLGPAIYSLAKAQLHNAIILLEKGYGIWDEVKPLLEQYGDVEGVPDKEDE